MNGLADLAVGVVLDYFVEDFLQDFGRFESPSQLFDLDEEKQKLDHDVADEYQVLNGRLQALVFFAEDVAHSLLHKDAHLDGGLRQNERLSAGLQKLQELLHGLH